MLQDNFFTIQSIQSHENSSEAAIVLNSAHPIFSGHFPGQPVVPGACLLQMVKEIMQDIVGEELQLIKAHHLKFIAMIDPVQNNMLQIELKHTFSSEKELAVTTTFSYDTKPCFKFSGVFSIAP